MNTSASSAAIVRNTTSSLLFSHNVKVGYEWMSVFVSGEVADEAARTFSLHLVINSSFGAFAWHYLPMSMGEAPDLKAAAIDFLSNVETWELLRRLVGSEPEVFDIEATRAKLEPLLRAALAEDYSDDDLEEKMEEVDEAFANIEGSEGPDLQAYLVYQSSVFHRIMGDDFEIDLKTAPSHRSKSAAKMLEVLWPPYVGALKT